MPSRRTPAKRQGFACSYSQKPQQRTKGERTWFKAEKQEIPPPEALNRNANTDKRLALGERTLQRKNAVLLLVCNDLCGKFGGNGLLATRKAVDQRRVAHDIDHAWDSTAGLGNEVASFERKKRPGRARTTDRLQTKGDIVHHLARAQ